MTPAQQLAYLKDDPESTPGPGGKPMMSFDSMAEYKQWKDEQKK